MRAADASCCLSNLGSIKTPHCRIQDGREYIMGKKDALRDNDQSCAGKSLLEMMEDRLDETVEMIMHADVRDFNDDYVLELKGMAKGITECIGLIIQPYHPDRSLVNNAIRDGAMDRYYTEYPEEADED